MLMKQEQEKRALKLRDRAVKLVNEKRAWRRNTQGGATALSYQDQKLSIAYNPAKGEQLQGMSGKIVAMGKRFRLSWGTMGAAFGATAIGPGTPHLAGLFLRTSHEAVNVPNF